MKKWEKYTDSELLTIINTSKSVREVAEKIGYAPDGGSGIRIIKEMIQQKHFDISHFLGQGWNKDNFDYSRFSENNNVKPRNALSALVALRGYKCEECQNTEWNNNPIPLEVHHIDGNHLNNDLSNLQLLCCNCHALTKNFRGKNITNRKELEITDEKFIQVLSETPNVRQALLKLGLTASGGNYARAYNLINKYNIIQSNK